MVAVVVVWMSYSKRGYKIAFRRYEVLVGFGKRSAESRGEGNGWFCGITKSCSVVKEDGEAKWESLQGHATAYQSLS